jgi:hypothetical protein
MTTMAWIAIAAMCLATGTVGVRLLAVWRRTRERPELHCGIALLTIGPIGFSLTMLSEAVAAPHPELGRALWAIAAGSLNLGTSMIFLFTAEVFYSLSPRMQDFSVFFAGWMFLLWASEIPVTGYDAEGLAGWPTRASDFMRAGALLWAGGKSLQHQGLLRRRLALGLGDPVASDRLLLWGVGIGSAGVVCLVDATAKLVGFSMFYTPGLLLIDTLAGFSASVGLYLAFVAREPLAWLRDPQPD